MAGKNLALNENKYIQFSEISDKKPCIFISHISIDMSIARKIANYIMEKGDINIYLDVYDLELQNATKKSDPQKITNLIEKGISDSTHLLCLISNDTKNSWWVPYEIGFAKSKSKTIASLRLKWTADLPEYLKIEKIITGIESLNSYLKKIKSTQYLNFSGLLESKSLSHQLSDCLDQD